MKVSEQLLSSVTVKLWFSKIPHSWVTKKEFSWFIVTPILSLQFHVSITPVPFIDVFKSCIGLSAQLSIEIKFAYGLQFWVTKIVVSSEQKLFWSEIINWTS